MEVALGFIIWSWLTVVDGNAWVAKHLTNRTCTEEKYYPYKIIPPVGITKIRYSEENCIELSGRKKD